MAANFSQNLVDSGMSKAASRIALENAKVRARMTVCHFAEDSKDAVELMKMLGIHPSQKDEDFDVDLPATPHTVRHTPPRKGYV